MEDPAYALRRPLDNGGTEPGFSGSRGGFSRPARRIYDARFEDDRRALHFLESCFLCRKQLGKNRDIFMYRGDMPFCSEECRQEKMEVDTAMEKKKKRSSSMKAAAAPRNKDESPSKNQDFSLRPGTVAAG